MNLDHYVPLISTRALKDRRETYDILVGIHKNVKSVVSREPQYVDSVLHPFFIVCPRPSRFDSLPRKDISYGVVSPSLQSRKVEVGILLGKRSRMEIDVISIEEVFWDMGWLIWIAWKLGVSGHVNPSECYLTSMSIAEVAIFNRKSEGCHTVQSRP